MKLTISRKFWDLCMCQFSSAIKFNSGLKLRNFHFSNVIWSAKVIDGRKIANDIQQELKVELEEWVKLGYRRPKLNVILVGEDEASKIYVKNKMKAASNVGIDSTTEKFPMSVTESQLLQRLEVLNSDGNIDGILVQLPLPKHISERAVSNAIDPKKDVDGFHLINAGKLCLDMKTIIPCTPLGIQEILKRTRIGTFGKHALVCGRSKNVGMPIAVLLHADGKGETSAMDATTTICHRYTPPELLSVLSKTADIIVTAAGVPNLIRPNMVKTGACVIDVGINKILDPMNGKPKLVGDVDFEGVLKVAGHITPVPGGVGPVTVAMLMKNTVTAAKQSML